MASTIPNSKVSAYFYILIRSWNSFAYFDRCIKSVLNQTYKNFKILYVDDASQYTTEQRNFIKKKLASHIVKFNTIRKYALQNAYEMIHEYADNPDAIILNLDGDDWLLNKNTLVELEEVYTKYNCWLAFGDCLLWDGKNCSEKPARLIRSYTNINYPKHIIRTNSYRLYPFLPLHPRSWKVWLFKKIKKEDFCSSVGSWLHFAEDQAIFYPMLEMAHGRFRISSIPLSVYNMASINSDLKLNTLHLLKDELYIRKKRSYDPLS